MRQQESTSVRGPTEPRRSSIGRAARRERGRTRALLISVVGRPTLLIQVTNVLSSLFLVGLYSRFLTADAYAAFVAVSAAQALSVALTASPASTSFMAQSTRDPGRRTVIGSWALLSSLVGAVPVLGVAYLVGLEPWGAAVAGLSYFALVAGDWSTARLLGLARFWFALGLTAARLAVTILAALALFAALGGGDTAAIPYLSLVLGGMPVLAHVVGFLRVGSQAAGASSFSALGVVNVGLWVVASLDRMVIGGLTSSTAAATYGLTYGIVDRGYRAVSASVVQRDLRTAFTPDSRPALWGGRKLAGLGVVTAAVALALPTAIRLISGGRYEPSLALSILSSTAGALSLAAAPALIACVAVVPLWRLALAAGAVALLNGVLLLLLISVFSVEGAAAASAASYLVWLLALMALLHRHRKSRSSP